MQFQMVSLYMYYIYYHLYTFRALVNIYTSRTVYDNKNNHGAYVYCNDGTCSVQYNKCSLISMVH